MLNCKLLPVRRLLNYPVAMARQFLSSTPHRAFNVSKSLFGEIIEVQGPPFVESINEGDIHWLKKQGDLVKQDEVVAEIETDKTNVEVPSPRSGKIVELLVEEGAKVVARQKLYKLEKSDG